MILCAAVRLRTTGTVIGCCRHGDGYSAIHDFDPFIGISEVEEGFLDNKGKFLTREEAFNHAVEIGQLSMTTYQVKCTNSETELYSEDLY